MDITLGRYWLFGAVCLTYAAAVLWLLLRRRLTLQSSLLFLLLLVGIGVSSVFLAYAPSWVRALGFELPSNLFFTASIGALSFLHLIALTTISRLELRSLTLVQEVALIQEELERNEIMVKRLHERMDAAGGSPTGGGAGSAAG